MTVHPYSRIFTGKTAAPTVNDDTTLGYEIGDEWLDETNNKSYKALDITDGAAVWIEITASTIFPYVAKTANYTLAIGDYTVECTANSFAITLPTAVGSSGKVYNIVNTGSGNIQILTTSSQTVCGYASGILYLYSGESLTVQSNGTNWILN